MRALTRGVGWLLPVLVLAACADTEVGDSTTTSDAPTPDLVATTVEPPPTTATLDVNACPTEFCVTYRIRPEAFWSDETPVTSVDFVYTFETFRGPTIDDGVSVGYDSIQSLQVIDEKTVRVVFSQAYGPWRTLFDRLLPAHVDDPRDFGVTSGFFTLAEHNDLGFVLTRSPNHWSSVDPLSGEALGDVEVLRFVPMATAEDQIEGLIAGDIDLSNPRPTAALLESVLASGSVAHELAAGPFWDHIDFNHSDPLLAQRWVREVFALSVDRETILDRTIRLMDKDAQTRDSAIWPTNSSQYIDHYDYPFDPSRAEQIMIDRFCVKNSDGVYECQGRTMRFVWATTSGDDFRRIQAELIRDSLATIGVELFLDFRNPSDLFSSDVFFGDNRVWQIMNCSWKSMADPSASDSTFFCSGDAPNGFGKFNVNRYCNLEVEGLVRDAGVAVDAQSRTSLYQEADTLYLADLAIIPLFQKLAFLAWREELSGPQVNISSSADTWNVAAWSGKNAVTFGILNLPILDPTALPTDEGDLVLSAMMLGAYGVTPSMEFVPVLIESAEISAREN